MAKSMQQDASTTAIRLIKMLSFIPQDSKGVSSSYIKDRLETHGFVLDVRTIQRDLLALSREFPLETRQEGRTNFWYFRKNTQNHWPAMSPDTALAVMMANQNLKPLIPESAQRGFDPIINQAKQTLSLQDRSGYSRWVKSVRIIPKGVFSKPPAVSTEVVNAIYQSIAKQRQLRIVKDGTESDVNPLGVAQRGQTLYLVCSYYTYDDIRITALHRIQSAQPLMTDLITPAGFDLDEVLNSGIMSWQLDPGKPKQFELEVSDDAVGYFEENQINDSQSIKSAGKNNHRVSFNTEDTLEIRQWLLGFGGEISVNKPAAVRNWIVKTAAEISNNYRR